MLKEILAEIEQERERQERLWGSEFDRLNTPNDWVAYIVRYVSEGAYDGKDRNYSPQRFRDFLMKAATLCVAAVESYEENGAFAERHYD